MIQGCGFRDSYGSDQEPVQCLRGGSEETFENRIRQSADAILQNVAGKQPINNSRLSKSCEFPLESSSDSETEETIDQPLAKSDLAVKSDAVVQTVTETIVFPTGAVYVGETRKGKMNGQGELTRLDGYVFAGEFKDNKLDGKGEIKHRDGFESAGIFVENRLKIGTIRRSDGIILEGEFENDRLNGKGRMIFPDGRTLFGTFKDNKLNGEGLKTHADGTKTMSNFRDSMLHGETIIRNTDGSLFRATFLNNNTSEPGTLTLANGRVIKGKFEDGNFIVLKNGA